MREEEMAELELEIWAVPVGVYCLRGQQGLVDVVQTGTLSTAPGGDTPKSYIVTQDDASCTTIVKWSLLSLHQQSMRNENDFQITLSTSTFGFRIL